MLLRRPLLTRRRKMPGAGGCRSCGGGTAPVVAGGRVRTPNRSLWARFLRARRRPATVRRPPGYSMYRDTLASPVRLLSRTRKQYVLGRTPRRRFMTRRVLPRPAQQSAQQSAQQWAQQPAQPSAQQPAQPSAQQSERKPEQKSEQKPSNELAPRPAQDPAHRPRLVRVRARTKPRHLPRYRIRRGRWGKW